MAPPMPRLNGRLTTVTPEGIRRSVSSVEPSSMTSTSYSGRACRNRRTTLVTEPRSLNTGTMTRHRGRAVIEVDGADDGADMGRRAARGVGSGWRIIGEVNPLGTSLIVAAPGRGAKNRQARAVPVIGPPAARHATAIP